MRLSALRASQPLPRGRVPILISVRGWFIPKAIEVNMQSTKDIFLACFKLLFGIDICDFYETAATFSINVYVNGLWRVSFILLNHEACIPCNLHQPPPLLHDRFQDIPYLVHCHWTRRGLTNPVSCPMSRGSIVVTRFWIFRWKGLRLHAKKTIFCSASCTTVHYRK
jgi:hypothetical protein